MPYYNTVRTNGAWGTWFDHSQPWSFPVKARVLCSDGKLRMTRRMAVTATADTYFSIPCAVKVKGKEVSGYLTTRTKSVPVRPHTNDEAPLPAIKDWPTIEKIIYLFIVNSGSANGKLLPAIDTVRPDDYPYPSNRTSPIKSKKRKAR